MEEVHLWELMNSAFDRMTFAQKRLWQLIKIAPGKWSQSPFGEATGGFWVVALFGEKVIWYNDLEYGFNISTYHRYGELVEFACDQLDLEVALQHVLNEFETGHSTAPRVSPPV